MSKDRKSFLLHIDSLDILEDLTIEESGQLFNAIRFYQLGEDMPLKGVVKIAFSPFRNQFIRDIEKYEITCKRRAEAGSKGGKQKVANLANASKCKQGVANVADSDSKNKNKSVSKSDNKSKSVSDIKPLVAFAPVDSVIFEYWKAVMGKDNSVKPTAGRMSKIKARLKDGYTEEQIKSAIDGCKSSSHHMGKNDASKVYDCLTLICRSAEKLDIFIGYTKVFNPEVKRDHDLVAWANTSIISQAQGEIYDHE